MNTEVQHAIVGIKGVGAHLMNRYAFRQYSLNALCLFWSFKFNPSAPFFVCFVSPIVAIVVRGVSEQLTLILEKTVL